jgi:hypothetical protein
MVIETEVGDRNIHIQHIGCSGETASPCVAITWKNLMGNDMDVLDIAESNCVLGPERGHPSHDGAPLRGNERS